MAGLVSAGLRKHVIPRRSRVYLCFLRPFVPLGLCRPLKPCHPYIGSCGRLGSMASKAVHPALLSPTSPYSSAPSVTLRTDKGLIMSILRPQGNTRSTYARHYFSICKNTIFCNIKHFLLFFLSAGLRKHVIPRRSREYLCFLRPSVQLSPALGVNRPGTPHRGRQTRDLPRPWNHKSGNVSLPSRRP